MSGLSGLGVSVGVNEAGETDEASEGDNSAASICGMVSTFFVMLSSSSAKADN